MGEEILYDKNILIFEGYQCRKEVVKIRGSIWSSKI